jgi:penicillin-binding protein 1C
VKHLVAFKEFSHTMLYRQKLLFRALAARFCRRPIRSSIALLIGIFALIIFTASLHGLFSVKIAKCKPSTLLLDRNYRFIASCENGNNRFGFWELPDTLPRRLRIATLAAEDRRFDHHIGVDLRSVARAFWTNITGKAFSGASTVAMQTARLQHGGNSGWYNKVRDAATAAGMTIIYGREKVLRQYLRIAPYGNRIAGAACASRRYFHKPVQDLSIAETALLAAIPRAPTRLNLFHEKGFAKAKKRARLIIGREREYGWISAIERDEALAELSTLRLPEKALRTSSCFHYLRACAAALGRDSTGAGEVRTALDLDLQESVQAMAGAEIPLLDQWAANNAAAMVVDARDGGILAYVGSADYGDPRGGAIDCAALPRSTGSLLKPFIYETGMEWQGYTAATVLTDLGFDFGVGLRSFVPENFDRKFMGPVLYKCALANSRNIPAVEVLKNVGIDLFYRQCVELGLARDDGKAGYYGLGLSIGGLYCSLQQICGAYLTLANNGERRSPSWRYPAATHSRGRQLMRPDCAMQIRRFLSDPVARLPTFKRGGNLEYPFAVAAKTGTSEGFRDSWCVAWSDRYIVAVWIGNVDFAPTKKLSGYEGAARLVKKIMLSLHPERVGGLDDIAFPPPPGYAPVAICRLTGKRADRETPYVTTEYFKPGEEPSEVSMVQRLLPIDKRNGLLACAGLGKNVEYRRFIVLDPAYRDWAESQGLEIAPDRYSPFCEDAAIVDKYEISITSPRTGTRFYIDPEMPQGKSLLPVTCRIVPPPRSVVWYVNGEEQAVTTYPFRFEWPMRQGKYEFQVGVSGTPCRSSTIKVEVY